MPLEFRFVLYLYILFLFCITLNLKDFCEARGTKIYAFSVYKICKKKKKRIFFTSILHYSSM